MVKIKIDGNEIKNQFPNMAHALVFAYQNGNCYGAKTLEIAVVAENTSQGSGDGNPVATSQKEKTPRKEKTPVSDATAGKAQEQTINAGDNKEAEKNVQLPDAKPHEEAALAEMTVEELVAILSGYGIAKIDNPTKEQLIEAILKAQEAVPENAENKAE